MQFKIFLLAAAAAVVSAVAPTTMCTDGCNPIAKPALGEAVPVGTPYAITWTPTTVGTVSIQLLRGPSTNVVPLGPLIASGIANTGTFSWTPDTTLEADVSHYGLQLINDADGTFQYSVQFGIANSAAPASSSSAVFSAYDSASTAAANVTSSYLPSVTISKYVVASTGYPLGNSSIIAPTGSLTVPSTLQTAAATSTVATAAGSSSSTVASASAKPSSGAAQLGMSLGGAVVALAGAVFAL